MTDIHCYRQLEKQRDLDVVCLCFVGLLTSASGKPTFRKSGFCSGLVGEC